MDRKIEGAWIIHHTDKLQNVRNATNDYEAVNFAGKCGLLLSSLAGTEDQSISRTKLEVLAKATNISLKIELPIILRELEKQKLITCSESEVNILGLTMATTLEHTATIFYDSHPENHEIAAINLSEKVSELPLDDKTAKEYISDTYKLDSTKTNEFLSASEQIGFVDAEGIDSSRKIIFNGNLFRRNEAYKIIAVCSALSESEIRKIQELDETLKNQGCIPVESAHQILEEILFKKLQSIGLYDVNTVENEKGKFNFVTKPAAFSRFGNSAVEDAFDLAKIFVTSLTFGMTQSQDQRGKIKAIERLMQKLINGEWVGPATAIGQDYKVLELRNVIQLKRSKYPNSFYMKLLKKDVGELALKVIISGDISTEAILHLPSASVTSYTSPERNRAYERKQQSPQTQSRIGELLDTLRTGG